jgi:hypothetical protein
MFASRIILIQEASIFHVAIFFAMVIKLQPWSLKTPNKFHFKLGILNNDDDQDRKFCMINNETSQHAPAKI